MDEIGKIVQSRLKPKEKQAALVGAVLFSGVVAVDELVAKLGAGSKAEKGACADALKHISADKPELVTPCLEALLPFINDGLPRVRWGVSEAIGNLARVCPEECGQAIPRLLKNTVESEVNTTVTRWCAAYALGELFIHNREARAELAGIFEELIGREENNGVRKVYERAMNEISR